MSENNRKQQTEGQGRPARPAGDVRRSGRPDAEQRASHRPTVPAGRPSSPAGARPPQQKSVSGRAGNSPAKKTALPAERKKQTSLAESGEEKKSLIATLRGGILAPRKVKDEKWDSQEIQRQRHGVDRPMLIIILVLIALGTVMVFSASFPSALKEKGDSYYYIRNQLMWVAIGGVLMTVISAVPYKLIRAFSPAAAIIAAVLLVLVLILGTARGVAQRWLSLGFVSFQPSEFAKAALILFLAYYIDKHYESISKRLDKKKSYWHGIAMPGLILFGFCGLVLLEKHLSGTIILGLIGVAIIFFSGANILWMALTYGSLASVGIVYYLMKNEYALKRIITHSDENADVLDEAWQTTQGLLAIGNGGLLGMGLGESNLNYNYVSEAHNDFIFTIWCEEMGFVGAILLIALYGVFIWRGVTIAKKAPDAFSSLTAFGITMQVGIQSALNIMVVTNIIPNTGVSLPFFSYGGTSLIILMAEMGILLSISKHSYQKK